MSDLKQIHNWSFLYCRLQGLSDYRGRVTSITTSPVISIESTPEGDIATTKSGSRYLLMECRADKSREEWLEVWKYWKETVSRNEKAN